MDRRGSATPRQAPGRFRCLPCRQIVLGTESGHCPRCGFVPPSAPDLPVAAPRHTRALWLLLVIATVVVVLAFVTN